jgi:undecaprenyl-diphosphatase
VAVAPGTLALSTLVSAAVALLTVRAFMALVERLGMWPFAVYRIALGTVLLWLAWR